MKMSDTWLRKMPPTPTLEEIEDLSPEMQINAWQLHMTMVKQTEQHNRVTMRRMKFVFKWVGILLLGTVAVLLWIIGTMVGGQ